MLVSNFNLKFLERYFAKYSSDNIPGMFVTQQKDTSVVILSLFDGQILMLYEYIQCNISHLHDACNDSSLHNQNQSISEMLKIFQSSFKLFGFNKKI